MSNPEEKIKSKFISKDDIEKAKQKKEKTVSKFQQPKTRFHDDIEKTIKSVSGKTLKPKLTKAEKLKKARARKQVRDQTKVHEKEKGDDERER